MLMNTLILSALPLALILINLTVSKKTLKQREKNSSFECGFDPISNARIPFSIQFFMISLMFLIFDIEITLLIPITLSINHFNIFMIISFSFFMLILIASIYTEYLENMIEWKT